MRLTTLLLAGLALGAASRFEEVVDGLSAGVSSNGTWLAAAFAGGAFVRPAGRGGAGRALAGSVGRAVTAGALVLTAANAGYYAYVVALQPGLDVAAVAGPPERWLVLGIAGGAVFGAAGRVWRCAEPVPRVVAALLLGGVLVVDASSGRLTDAPGLAAGLALPILSARGDALRTVTIVAAAVVVAVASTGALEPLMP